MNATTTSILDCRAGITYGEFALDVEFQARINGVTGLFGPSGGGKSSLLRAIAGFERSLQGAISLDDDVWLDSASGVNIPAHRRSIGFVFQDARLFEHIDVQGNLRYATQRSPVGPLAFPDVADALEIGGFLERSVTELSGGQQQRVAIARALLCQPKLMLMDEPLAGLDHRAKRRLLPYIRNVAESFAIPTVFVSHAVDEIAQLADDVLVMDAGRLIDQGPVVETLNRVSGQLGTAAIDTWSIIEARVCQHDAGMQISRAEVDGQSVYLPGLSGHEIGENVRLLVRASDVSIAMDKPGSLSIRNVLQATVSEVRESPDSPFADLTLQTGTAVLKSRLTRHAISELAIRNGSQVFALLKTASLAPR